MVSIQLLSLDILDRTAFERKRDISAAVYKNCGSGLEHVGIGVQEGRIFFVIINAEKSL